MRYHQQSDTQPVVVRNKRPLWFVILGSCLGFIFIFLSVLMGGYTGYQSGHQEIARAAVLADFQQLQEQFFLGMQDFNEGNLELARQRFEYILARDPNFPGAADRLVDTLRILYATSTPTAIPPTPTLTPTRDMRPVEELLELAKNYFDLGDWNNVIDTLIALRKENPDFRVVDVDSLLFRSLRNRGIQKIQSESNLEGGIYDLALADRFGPIDEEAKRWRNLARIYMIGLGFWEVYPQQAVYYFGQVAAAAPYLRDASGWTASGRYRESLLHYADQLAREGDWCEAESQYLLALSLGADNRIQATAVYAQLQCSPPTHTPTFTQTITQTPTATTSVTPWLTVIITPTETSTLSPSPSATVSSTAPIPETVTSTLSSTPTPPSSTTPTPSQTPQPSPSPTPSPTSG